MSDAPHVLALIEDQAPIRETLHEYLSAQPEFWCAVVAGSVEEFLAALPGAAPTAYALQHRPARFVEH